MKNSKYIVSALAATALIYIYNLVVNEQYSVLQYLVIFIAVLIGMLTGTFISHKIRR
jgi:hypothetical protein